MSIATIVQLLFSLLSIYIFAAYFWKYYQLKSRGLYIDAVVVNHREKADSTEGGMGYNYYPVIEFQVDGEKYIEKVNVGFASIVYKKGAKLKILIDKRNPENFVVWNNKMKLYHCIFGLVGIGILIKVVVYI